MSDTRWAKVEGCLECTVACQHSLRPNYPIPNTCPLPRLGDIPEVRALVEAARCFVSAQKRLPDESVRAAISRRTHFESRLSDALAAFDKGEEPK